MAKEENTFSCRPFLHSYQISFYHPMRTDEKRTFTAPIPKDIKSLIIKHVYPDRKMIDPQFFLQEVVAVQTRTNFWKEEEKETQNLMYELIMIDYFKLFYCLDNVYKIQYLPWFGTTNDYFIDQTLWLVYIVRCFVFITNIIGISTIQ